MSLIRMLDDKTSVLSRFIAQRLPNLGAWRSAYRERLPAVPALRPAWDGQPGPVPYSTLGHAIDARLRLALAWPAVGECFETGVCRYTTDALVSDGLLGAVGGLDQVRDLLVHDIVLGLPSTSPELSRGRRHVGAAAARALNHQRRSPAKFSLGAGPL